MRFTLAFGRLHVWLASCQIWWAQASAFLAVIVHWRQELENTTSLGERVMEKLQRKWTRAPTVGLRTRGSKHSQCNFWGRQIKAHPMLCWSNATVWDVRKVTATVPSEHDGPPGFAKFCVTQLSWWAPSPCPTCIESMIDCAAQNVNQNVRTCLLLCMRWQDLSPTARHLPASSQDSTGMSELSEGLLETSIM